MSGVVELLCSWSHPRAIVLAAIAIGAAGCSSESARFNEGLFASQSAPSEATGSVPATRPAAVGRVDASALPPPAGSQLASTAAGTGTAGGGRGVATYHPGTTAGPADTTGSVQPRKQATAPASHPTTKGVTHTAGANGLGVHIVAPGETLTKISRIYKKSPVELAKINKMEQQATLRIGDKIVIPGLRTTNVQPKDAPKATDAKPLGTPPKAPPPKQAAVTSEPTQSASVVTPAGEAPAAATGSLKAVEGAPPSFRWPVKARIIAGFGPRTNGQQNDGINLAVPEGTPVKAAEDGVVAYAGSELKGYGNLVLVRHSNGYVTAYAHAKELMVKRGDPIKRGQVIAKSGQTGNVDAPQLHFEIRKGPAPVDPMPMLSGG